MEEAGEIVPLTDVPLGQVVELLSLQLPERQAEPLLERGVLPGCRLSRAVYERISSILIRSPF